MNSFISYKFVTKLKLFADATIKMSTNKDQRTFKNKKQNIKNFQIIIWILSFLTNL